MKLYNNGSLIDIEEIDFDNMIASYYDRDGASGLAGLVQEKVELWDLFPSNSTEAIQLKIKSNDLKTCEDAICENEKSEYDVVDKPKHYQIGLGDYQMKDVSYALIKHNELDGEEGAAYFNILKYLGRYKNKGVPLQDLNKSLHYLKDLIEIEKTKQ